MIKSLCLRQVKDGKIHESNFKASRVKSQAGSQSALRTDLDIFDARVSTIAISRLSIDDLGSQGVPS